MRTTLSIDRKSGRTAGRIALRATALALAVVPACKPTASPQSQPPPPGAPFFAPQAVAASERWILVASTGFSYRDGRPSWDAGRVTFVDRVSRQVVGRVATTQRNPQSLAVHGERAYVVNGGTIARATGPNGIEVWQATSPGGVDLIDLSGVAPPASVAANIPLELSRFDRRVGSFGSIALSADGRRAFVGSGTRGDLFEIDLEQQRVVRGAEDPIALFATPADRNGLTVVRPWPQQGTSTGDTDGLAVLNFNRDELCLSRDLAAGLARRDCQRVGVNHELLEGPVDVVFDAAGRALVLMSLANAVYRVELGGAQPAGGGEETPEAWRIDARFARTGLGNNRLHLHRDRAYVVNSLSNNLQRIDLHGETAGNSALPFVVLPVSSNPYDLAITDEAEGPIAWVTLQGSHQLAVVDLATGDLLQLIGHTDGETTGPADAGTTETTAADAGPGDGALQSCDAIAGVIGIESVVAVSYGEGAGLGQDALPAVIQGGPRASGDQGLLSLGVGGELVVDFGDRDIVDGPGPDFIVYENPFLIGGAPYCPFAEPAVVGVSNEPGAARASFVEFPCDLDVTQGDPDEQRWPFPGCAGVRPVIANVERVCIDPRDPVAAGGDAFDLATVGIKRARYVRLRDAGLASMGVGSKGFDLDAVVLINSARRP